MINVPSVYGQDWESMIAKARQNILNKISRILGEDISKLILFEEQLTPQLIQKIKHILIRVPYTVLQAIVGLLHFPSQNFSSQYKTYFFCGGSVHPGGGIPLALISKNH
jgi:phytoene dehydrogenase-like protein